MSIYWHDLIIFIVFGGLAIFAWRTKKKEFKMLAGVVAVILIFVNPIRFNSGGGVEQIERNVSRFDEIPHKVEVQRPSFEERQAAEHEQLKTQNEEIQDEL